MSIWFLISLSSMKIHNFSRALKRRSRADKYLTLLRDDIFLINEFLQTAFIDILCLHIMIFVNASNHTLTRRKRKSAMKIALSVIDVVNEIWDAYMSLSNRVKEKESCSIVSISTCCQQRQFQNKFWTFLIYLKHSVKIQIWKLESLSRY